MGFKVCKGFCRLKMGSFLKKGTPLGASRDIVVAWVPDTERLRLVYCPNVIQSRPLAKSMVSSAHIHVTRAA